MEKYFVQSKSIKIEYNLLRKVCMNIHSIHRIDLSILAKRIKARSLYIFYSYSNPIGNRNHNLVIPKIEKSQQQKKCERTSKTKMNGIK